GVLGMLAIRESKRHRAGESRLFLMRFLAADASGAGTYNLEHLLSGDYPTAERGEDFAAAGSFGQVVVETYGPERLAIFARSLEPAAPDEAAGGAFHKPFHAVEGEWIRWARAEKGQPLLTVPGSVVRSLALFGREGAMAIAAYCSMVPQLAYILLMP